MVPLWFAPYAVATGNCIVLKPSSEDPISQIKIAELAEEAGIPLGVWNVVNGGRIVVTGMLENPDIKGICFVGSTPVGRDVIVKVRRDRQDLHRPDRSQKLCGSHARRKAVLESLLQ